MKGKNVYLRPIENSDIDFLNKCKNDENLFKYLGGGFKPTSKIEQIKWIENMAKMDSGYRFIICNKMNDFPVGFVGLYEISLINRNSEIGLYIADEKCRGKGYASETLEILEKYCTNYLNFKKIKLKVVKNNKSALNFWKKNDYKIVGELHDERFIDGDFHDVILMEKFLKGESNEFTHFK